MRNTCFSGLFKNWRLILAFVLTLAFNAAAVQARDLIGSIGADVKLKGFFLTEAGELQVIMPEAGKGRQILIALRSDEKPDQAGALLSRIFACKNRIRQHPTPLVAENKYEEELQAQFPDLHFFVINSFLPAIIQNRFNRKPDFGGPNCFNTALAVTGGIDHNETRHVSLNEFKARLAILYTEIQTETPLAGDVLLYNSSDHAAVYLGGDRVFHKKDLHKEYYFRMPRKLEVFQADPGEWVPGLNYCGPYSKPGDTKVRKLQVFRRNSTPFSAWDISTGSRAEFNLVNLLKSSTMKNAPAWSLGKVMGYWSEVLADELVSKLAATMQTDESGKQLLTELESVRDQIFIAIEDSYFSSPYAKPDKIIREIWFYDNEYARTMIRKIRDYYGLISDEESLNRICNAIKAINGDFRGKSLLAIIKSDN